MKDVIIGIRYEEMEIVNQGLPHIEFMIFSIELTGEQTIVTSKIGSNYFTFCEDKDYESDFDITVNIKLYITKHYYSIS